MVHNNRRNIEFNSETSYRLYTVFMQKITRWKGAQSRLEDHHVCSVDYCKSVRIKTSRKLEFISVSI